jgi:hypothetical protein
VTGDLPDPVVDGEEAGSRRRQEKGPAEDSGEQRRTLPGGSCALDGTGQQRVLWGAAPWQRPGVVA